MRGIDGPAGVSVSYRVVQGDPADVLVRESRTIELLVMGSHGVEGLMHSALGSVTDTCARMAECPVVVVPARREHAADDLVPAGTGKGRQP
jgi:nucleotide-binding universal stress UspA family protein